MSAETVAVIPARGGSKSVPRKNLLPIAGKPMIQHGYERTQRAAGVARTLVATDDERVAAAVRAFGGDLVMTGTHATGTDRLAEVVRSLGATEIVVNVQGDEPFVQKAPLQKLLNLFNGEVGKNVQIASLMQVMKDQQLIEDPNYVKVAVNKNMEALMFSRSILPYHRDKNTTPVYYEHIGVYAFRKQALMDFTNWAITPLEAAEKIECLRYLENGVLLKMAITEYMGVEIDTPEDLKKATQLLEKEK